MAPARARLALVATFGAAACTGAAVLRPPADAPPVVDIRVAADEPAPATAEQQQSESDEEMIWIPGGAFTMGTTTCDGDEAPEQRVVVRGFYLDATEVSTKDYTSCVAEGRCAAEGPPPRDDEPEDAAHCNAHRRDRADHPMNCVTWTQADRYCRVHGKRLPTEPEWEFAARGPEGRAFPWGNPWDGDRVCWKQQDGTCPIGAHRSGDTPLGLADMAGNVWEWTGTHYCRYDNPGCEDIGYVDRGGGWISDDPRLLHSAHRGRGEPETWASYLGFRCARDR